MSPILGFICAVVVIACLVGVSLLEMYFIKKLLPRDGGARFAVHTDEDRRRSIKHKLAFAVFATVIVGLALLGYYSLDAETAKAILISGVVGGVAGTAITFFLTRPN